MKYSHIEWTDHTFNPWEGCTKVSPGCAHCYAEARNRRFANGANWGPGSPRRRTGEENRRQPVRWNFEATKFLFNHGFDKQAMRQWHRPRVFCASLADWLDDEVPIEWLADLLDLIRKTPNLDWLLLTKRPENWAKRISAVHRPLFETDHPLRAWLAGWAAGGTLVPANVWIGTTVEDQQRADERIPKLLEIPARVRFLSCEPLLGPVNLDFGNPRFRTAESYHSYIHWVICGGESGHGARPMHPDWARSLRDQCGAADVAFFFKQWGEWAPTSMLWKGSMLLAPNGKTYPNDDEHHDIKVDYPFRDHRALLSPMTKVGKREAGRLLDGREHSAFPEVR